MDFCEIINQNPQHQSRQNMKNNQPRTITKRNQGLYEKSLQKKSRGKQQHISTIRIKITTSKYFHYLLNLLPKDSRIQEVEIKGTLPNFFQPKFPCYKGLNVLLQWCTSPHPRIWKSLELDHLRVIQNLRFAAGDSKKKLVRCTLLFYLFFLSNFSLKFDCLNEAFL